MEKSHHRHRRLLRLRRERAGRNRPQSSAEPVNDASIS
jgi:hypothetical protein